MPFDNREYRRQQDRKFKNKGLLETIKELRGETEETKRSETRKIETVTVKQEKPKPKFLTMKDLKPLECFVYVGGEEFDPKIRTHTGYVYLATGRHWTFNESVRVNDPILRAIPKNPVEFEIEPAEEVFA